MTEPYIGEIRLFALAAKRPPIGWLRCKGQLLLIAENQALYSVIGNIYGGNGTSTFAIPDLQGRAAVGVGVNAREGNIYNLGSRGGVEQVLLTEKDIPAHTHAFQVSNTVADSTSVAGAVYAATAVDGTEPPSIYAKPKTWQKLDATSLQPSPREKGVSSSPHNNMQPYLAMDFFIATRGYFPSRAQR